MNCTKCHQEFTASDKSEANWTGYHGNYKHKVCPNTTICTVCNETIADYTEAQKTPANLGTGWMHKTCTFTVKAQPKSNAQANPSNWIVR